VSNGYPDAAVLLAHSSASWETPPAVLAGAALAVLLFAQAFVRLRGRRRRRRTKAWMKRTSASAVPIRIAGGISQVLDEWASGTARSG